MRNFIRYFFAIFLIGAGVLLVLDNLGIADFGIRMLWHYVYPVFILVIGLKWLFDYVTKRGRGWFLGAFFTVFGGLLILDRLEVLTFYFRDVFKLWPLLIIYIGFLLIGMGRNRRSFVTFFSSNDNDSRRGKMKGVNRENFTIGSQEYSQPNWKAEPMDIRTFAGDFYLDFSKAFIPEKEIPVTIRSMAGDVHILIPEHVAFKMEAHVKAGDINVLGNEIDGINRSYFHETDNYDESEQRLDFYINLKAGSVRVDQV